MMWMKKLMGMVITTATNLVLIQHMITIMMSMTRLEYKNMYV